jgi:hypothetical protein
LCDHAEQNKLYRISVEQLTAALKIVINSVIKKTVKNSAEMRKEMVRSYQGKRSSKK